MRALLIIAPILALGACAQVQGLASRSVHPLVDRYCTEADPQVREQIRAAFGTTAGGATIRIDCPVIAAE